MTDGFTAEFWDAIYDWDWQAEAEDAAEQLDKLTWFTNELVA